MNDELDKTTAELEQAQWRIECEATEARKKIDALRATNQIYRDALENISALDYTKAATTGACALAVRIAKESIEPADCKPEAALLAAKEQEP